jgi:hypothetical protein
MKNKGEYQVNKECGVYARLLAGEIAFHRSSQLHAQLPGGYGANLEESTDYH